MLYSRLIQVGLVSLILFITGAIAWSFISRQTEYLESPAPKLLSPEISRHSTKFEYSEHKAGRIVFTVDAETSIETVDRVHTLSNVSLKYFGQSDVPSDVILSEVAVYRIRDRVINFSKNVRIVMEDGTKIFSEKLSVDLVKEFVTIEQNFRFQRGKISGAGTSMIYALPQRQIRVQGGLKLSASAASSHIEAGGETALYRLRAREVQLSGRSYILGAESRLSGDSMTLFLNEESQIQKILSLGHCKLEFGSLKSFSGHRINGFFETTGRRPGFFEVLGGNSESGATRAVYEERCENGVNVIEANQISGSPRATGMMKWGALEKISAQGEVLLQLSQLDIEKSTANHLVGHFFQGGEALRQISLKGAVSITRRGGPSKTLNEKLQCKNLILKLESADLLKTLIARGNVNLRMDSADYYRHLSARDFVRIRYELGVPKHVVSSGGCSLENGGEREKNVLTAASFEISYYRGLVRQVIGEGGTELVLENGGEIRRTRSDRVEVQYENGEVKKAIQSGRFRFWQEGAMRAELKAAYAIFEPLVHTTTFGGNTSPRLRLVGEADLSNSETLAEKFKLDQETGQIEGLGLVRSVFHGKSELIIITAEKMDANLEAGWINYSSHPRIVQGSNTITGKLVRYSLVGQDLSVEGGVESVFVEEDEFGEQRYHIAADSLFYGASEFRARYEGKVKVQTQDFFIEAPFVEFLFTATESNRLQEMIAWGGVKIRGGDRSAEGTRAVHFPYERKVVLTGDPAKIFESAAGQATGSQLIFFVGDERIFVEGLSPKSP